MKKLLLLLISLTVSAAAFTSCGLFNKPSSSSPSESSSEYEEKKYTVTFKQSGCADVVREVVEGEDLTDVPQPQAKTGYTVVWETVSLKNVKKNVVVNAIETANEYVITYNANEGTVTPATQTVTYDSTVELAVPEKAGYEFAGWKKEDGTAVTNGTWKIAENITLYANWNLGAQCTVTFKQDGQADIVKKVSKGGALATADIPTPQAVTGYTLSWSVTDFSNITEDIEVTVVATANEYEVTYDANGGAVTPAKQTVTFGEDETLATPTKDGYEFKGWYTQENVAVTGENWSIANDVTLVAKWEEIKQDAEIVKVTFKQDGYADVEKEVEKGSALTDIPTPQAVTGYTLSWSVTDFSNITSNMTVTVIKTANTYEISFDTQNDVANPAKQTVTFGEDETLPVLQNTTSHKFKGWSYEGNAVSGKAWNIAGNVTLVAIWEEKTKYNVTFVQNGCDDIVIPVYEGAMFSGNVNVTAKPGYDISWNADDMAKLNNPITAPVTVNAVVKNKTYTITFKYGNGAADKVETVTFDAAYNYDAPTRKGYTFNGWKIGDKDFTASGKWAALEVDGVYVIEAVWEANTYTVKFVNGSEKTEVTVTYGQEYTLPTPTKTGYEFVGWKYKDQILKGKIVWELEHAEGSWIELEAQWKEEEGNWTNNY